MIVLYLTLVLVLGLTKFVIWRRVSSLEKKYTKVAGRAKELAVQPQYKAGNSNKPRDSYQLAKRYYELGRLVEKRDRVETKYARWQNASDRVGKAVTKVRGWKGKLTPYAFGAVDLLLVMTVAQELMGESLVTQLQELVTSLFS